MIVVRCKSRFSGISSICKKDGEIIEFPNKEIAEQYAEKCRNLMGLNYHYWVSEE
jgi:hypothetical protein